VASKQILISTEWGDDSLCCDQVAELMQKWFSGLLWSECHCTYKCKLEEQRCCSVGFSICSTYMNIAGANSAVENWSPHPVHCTWDVSCSCQELMSATEQTFCSGFISNGL